MVLAHDEGEAGDDGAGLVETVIGIIAEWSVMTRGVGMTMQSFDGWTVDRIFAQANAIVKNATAK